MNLTPREKDKLLISMAATVARRRLERGVKLNFPAAVALISDFVVDGARAGRSGADLMEGGASVLTRDQVMDGIAEMIHAVRVEATFPDGTKLVTVHEPIRGSVRELMTNRDRVIEFLRRVAPDEASNADILSGVGIKPHQQIFRITNQLVSEGLIRGRKLGKEWVFT